MTGRSAFLKDAWNLLPGYAGWSMDEVTKDIGDLFYNGTPEQQNAFFADVAKNVDGYDGWKPEDVHADLKLLFTNPVPPKEKPAGQVFEVPASVKAQVEPKGSDQFKDFAEFAAFGGRPEGAEGTRGGPVVPMKRTEEGQFYTPTDMEAQGQKLPATPESDKLLKDVAKAKEQEAQWQKIGEQTSLQNDPDLEARRQALSNPSELIERPLKGFARGTLNTLEGIAGGGQWMGIPGSKEVADKLAEWGGAMQYKNPNFLDEVFAGAGSMAVFWPFGFGMGSAAKLLTKFSPKMFSWVASGASGGLEAASEAGAVWREVYGKTKDKAKADDAANKTALWNGVINTVLDKYGIFGEKAEGIRRALFSASAEGIQEGLQQVTSNIQTGRPAEEGVLESIGIGAMMGGAVGVAAPQFSEKAPEGDKGKVELPPGFSQDLPPLDLETGQPATGKRAAEEVFAPPITEKESTSALDERVKAIESVLQSLPGFSEISGRRVAGIDQAAVVPSEPTMPAAPAPVVSQPQQETPNALQGKEETKAVEPPKANLPQGWTLQHIGEDTWQLFDEVGNPQGFGTKNNLERNRVSINNRGKVVWEPTITKETPNAQVPQEAEAVKPKAEEKPTPTPQAEKPTAKQPWEMSHNEFVDWAAENHPGEEVRKVAAKRAAKESGSGAYNALYHARRTEIAKAIAANEPVPPEVLKDYPDLVWTGTQPNDRARNALSQIITLRGWAKDFRFPYDETKSLSLQPQETQSMLGELARKLGWKKGFKRNAAEYIGDLMVQDGKIPWQSWKPKTSDGKPAFGGTIRQVLDAIESDLREIGQTANPAVEVPPNNSATIRQMLEQGKSEQQIREQNIPQEQIDAVKAEMAKERPVPEVEANRLSNMPAPLAQAVKDEAKNLLVEAQSVEVMRGGISRADSDMSGRPNFGAVTNRWGNKSLAPEWFKDLERSKDDVIKNLENIIKDDPKNALALKLIDKIIEFKTQGRFEAGYGEMPGDPEFAQMYEAYRKGEKLPQKNIPAPPAPMDSATEVKTYLNAPNSENLNPDPERAKLRQLADDDPGIMRTIARQINDVPDLRRMVDAVMDGGRLQKRGNNTWLLDKNGHIVGYVDHLRGIGQVRDVPLSQIEPYETAERGMPQRSELIEKYAGMTTKAPMIAAHGPRFEGDTFQVINGHHRYEAAKRRGDKTIRVDASVVLPSGATLFVPVAGQESGMTDSQARFANAMRLLERKGDRYVLKGDKQAEGFALTAPEPKAEKKPPLKQEEMFSSEEKGQAKMPVKGISEIPQAEQERGTMFEKPEEKGPEIPFPEAQKPIASAEDYKRVLVEQAGYTPEQAEVHAQLQDARAEAWSQQTGRPKEEWYSSRIGEVKQGGVVSGEALSQLSKSVTDSPAFKRWFGESKVVTEDGEPKMVFSGHANVDMYGKGFNPRKGTSGAFYSTEDPQVASAYAFGKLGEKEYYENGDQYRLAGKNGQLNKKLWQYELSEEQKKKFDELAKEKDKNGEDVYTIDQMRYWAEHNKNFDAFARRILAQPYSLFNLWQFNEYMGYNIAYAREAKTADEPLFLRQRRNATEYVLDAMGIRWNSFDWAQPGVIPVFLSIKNPLDTSKPVPAELLAALQKAVKGERRVSQDEINNRHWTKDYPLRNWVDDITRQSETGEETYWATQVPKKALPILKRFGYDGIRDIGGKARQREHPVWIAFDPEQIKSATGNRGTFDPTNPDMLYQENAPTFYSSLSKAVDELTQEKWQPQQLLGKLRSTPGIKQEEMAWTGLETFLSEKKGPVTKSEVQDYLRANNVEVKEVVKGEPRKAVWRKSGELSEYIEGTFIRVVYLPSNGKYALEVPGGQPDLYDDPAEAKRDAEKIYGYQSPVGAAESSKFESYVLPGAKEGTYRELLLTLPGMEGMSKTERASLRSRANELQFEADALRDAGRIAEAAAKNAEAGKLFDALTKDVGVGFRSAHFDEPNILAHVRFNERTDADGKKVLFIEEVQSDWHEKGRKEGYVGSQKVEVSKGKDTAGDYWGVVVDGQELGRYDTEADANVAAAEFRSGKRKTGGAVPNAPFKSTWPELAMKRMIRWAAENGYDKVAWTTGEQQAARYDLSKAVDAIQWKANKPVAGEAANVYVTLKGIKGVSNQDVELGVNKETGVVDVVDIGAPREWEGKKLADVIGKDVADRVLREDSGDLRGEGLRVGGEGMKGFYDQILPSIANKLGKRFGGRVTEAVINTGIEQKTKVGGLTVEDKKDLRKLFSDSPGMGYDEFREAYRDITGLDVTEERYEDIADVVRDPFFARRAGYLNDLIRETNDFVKAAPKGNTNVHSLDITPSMRESAMRVGFPLFQEKKGAIEFTSEGKAIIHAIQADLSTMAHESFHLWRRDLYRTAGEAKEEFRPQIEEDIKTLETWVGAKDGNWTREQEEKFARAGERYLRTGEAPNSKLQQVFERFKAWLTDIYKAIAGSPLDVELTPEVKAVFDRLIDLESSPESVDTGELFGATLPGVGEAYELTTKVGGAMYDAFKGKPFIPEDNLASAVAHPAHRSVRAIKEFIRRIGLPSYIGDRVPGMKPVFYALRESGFEGNQRFAQVEKALEAVKKDFKPTPEEAKHVADALYRGNDKDVQKYFSDGELQRGIQLQNGTTLRLNDREIQIYQKLVDAQKMATQIRIDSLKYFLMQHGLSDIEVMTLPLEGYSPAGSPNDLVTKIYSLLSRNEQKIFEDGVAALKANGSINDFDLRNDFDQVKRLIHETVADYQAKKEVEKLGGYISLKRHGDWYVSWWNADHTQRSFQMFELPSEMRRFETELRRSGQATDIKSGEKQKSIVDFYSDKMSLFELQDIVEEMGIQDNPEVQKLVDQFKARGVSAYTIKRDWVPGYSRTYDSAIRSIYDFARASGRHLGRSKGKVESYKILDKIEGMGDAKQLTKEYIDAFFGSDSNDASIMRKALYTSALAWSPTFTIQQMFQPIVMHLPNLSLEVGAGRDVKILTEAYALTAAYMSGRIGGRKAYEGLARSMGVDPVELSEMIKKGVERGSLHGSMIEELAGATRLGGRLLAPKTTEVLSQLGMEKDTIQNALFKTEKAIDLAGSQTEKANRINGFIQGYIIGKSKGLTGDALFQNAERWTERVNIPYGKENLPIALSQIKSRPVKALARLAYAFQSFQSAMMHMMSNTIRSDAKLSRKAAAAVTGAAGMVLSAGVTGLPFYMVIKSIANGLSDDDDTPDAWLKKLDWLPEMMLAVLRGGVPALAGVDLRRSLGAGDMNPLDVSRNVLYSMFQRAKAAAKAAERGEWSGVAQQAPIGVPPLIKAQVRANEAAKYGVPYGARTLIPPKDLTPTDLLKIRLGFTPSKVGQARDVQTTIGQAKARRAGKMDAFADSYARARVDGDSERAKKIIEELKAFNKANPELRINADSFNAAWQRRRREMIQGTQRTEGRQNKVLRREMQ